VATPNLSEIVTATERYRYKRVVDAWSNNNALGYKLKKKGKVSLKDGGYEIQVPLEFSENTQGKYYSGGETLSTSRNDVLSSAIYEWKQFALPVQITGDEKRKNSGSQAKQNLYKIRVRNGEKSLWQKLSTDVYSNGLGDGGKQIGGLELLLPNNPATGTVGGIDRATWTFWRHFAYAALTTGGAVMSASNIEAYFRRVWLNTTRAMAGDKPDLLVSDNAPFEHYWTALGDRQRFVSSSMADAGFTALKFMSADYVYDGGIGGQAPTNKVYFLNTDYIELAVHKDLNFEQLGGKREPINQDIELVHLGFMANLVLSNSKPMGVLHNG
jgi:hypothetical protein